MCYGCFEEYNSPKIINNATKHAAKLIGDVFNFSSVGGNLHIAIDDFNIEDSDIDWCINTALETNVQNASKEQLLAEKRCLDALKELTIPERASAIALYEGWLD